MSRWQHGIALAAVGMLLLAGCAKKQEEKAAEETAAPATTAPAPAVAAVAIATLTSADGVNHGTITFTQNGDQTRVVADVTGVPAGLHGIHVHETGDCTPPDFKSAGGHFNPTGAIHGAPTDPEHHAGDLGNIDVGEDGTGHLDLNSNMLAVDDGPNSVIGKSVILHAGEDDFVSQPSGASGDRWACGVIGSVTATGQLDTGSMQDTGMAGNQDTEGETY
jgi:Cu-Zn family superoxide dismutase